MKCEGGYRNSSCCWLLLAVACDAVVGRVHEWIRPTVREQNAVVMSEATYLCEGFHVKLVADANATILRPCCRLEDLPRMDWCTPRLLSGFGIPEKHGDARKASVRNSGDGKAMGHSDDSVSTATHRPADLDLIAVSRRVAEVFPNRPLAGFPSDVKGAYGQVTADPMQALDVTNLSRETDRNSLVFFIAVAQLFGIGHALLN